MKPRIISTASDVLYREFNKLHYTDTIVIENERPFLVNNLLNKINKEGIVVDVKQFDNMFIIKRKNPFNFKVYKNTKKNELF